MRNPYKIEGPALISFSGGRTSGYMLKHILDAHGGTLPDDVKVTFANTGREMPETLEFVQECASRWDVPVVWLEWRNKTVSDGASAFEIVSHNSASRDGEPFKALIDKKGYLPNPITRFCTGELKIRVMRDYARSLGWKNWTNVIGLRADEPIRVARARTNRDAWDNDTPLATSGVSRAHVTAFWQWQGFDLRLPNNDGNTPLGNCDLCFLKGGATILGIIRERPELAKWWAEAEAEAEARASKPDGARFRKDRPGYAAMLKMSQQQEDLFALDNNTQPCGCHD
jgi:3'-phosphoadenosine 5'-phosphosulfate sulfotransferase (PAPS reductase)/FAD synthetase